MKCFLAIIFIIIFSHVLFGDDFLRDLPDEKLNSMLSPERFKNMDAVIVLKEQSYKIEKGEAFYRGIDLEGLHTTFTKVIIAKLFNESAVKRYGSFEFEYYERYGDEIPNGFEAKARVMKPDGKVLIMEESEINTIISRESSNGRPLNRKVLFKIPNLAIGDVVQIEYTFTSVFSASTSNMFFYNDRDFVLYSNLYITLPSKMQARYINFSEERIGKPRIEQVSSTFGAGETYFWGLKNLYPIPDEVYSRPFSDQSLMTAFVVERDYMQKTGTWETITGGFYDYYIDQDDIDQSQIEFIGVNLNSNQNDQQFDSIDLLYKNIREKFKLQTYTSLYPLSDDIDSIFDKKEGDASDLSYIFYKILKQSNIDAKIVWIRDKREGKYELTVPSRRWFDRLGVLVNVNGNEKLYDFDICVPYQYLTPWYLNGQSFVVINENSFEHKVLKDRININDNLYIENHVITLDSSLNLFDEIQLKYSGAAANRFREEYYSYSKTQMNNKLESIAKQHCLSTCDSTLINDFVGDNDINIFANGFSLGRAEEIDSFMIFKLRNHSIEEFYNEIYSTARSNDYIFNGPFKIIAMWDIDIPRNYTIHKNYPDKNFPPVGQISAKVKRSLLAQKYRVTVNLAVNNEFLSYKNHPNLIILLENLRKELEQDIVLKKIQV